MTDGRRADGSCSGAGSGCGSGGGLDPCAEAEIRSAARSPRLQHNRRALYANSDVTAADVERTYTWISEATGIPAGALRPGDRFDRELKPRAGWEYDDPLSLFFDEIARDAAKAGVAVKPEEVATVDDVVQLMKRRDGSK